MNKLGKLNSIAWGVLFCGFLGVFFASCATTYSEKMYADVIGFNDKIYESYMPPPRNPKDTDEEKPIPGVVSDEGKPYDLSIPSQAKAMQDAINNVPLGQNTAALYALDVGLDRVALVNKKFMEGDPKSRYYVIFFTDGIDNASVEKAIQNRRGKYPRGITGRDAYAAAMHARMEQILKKYSFFGWIKKPSTTNSFQSYVVLFKGDDLASYSDSQLEKLLDPFRASQNAGDPPALIVDTDMGALLEKFREAFVIPTFSFQVPKDYVDQRVRMLLSMEDQVFFEATLKYQQRGKLYTLEDITVSNGFTFEENTRGIRIEMDKDLYDANASTVPFIINELKVNGKSYSVTRGSVTQWHDEGTGTTSFQNTEYRGSGGGKKNAYVLLIMDTSLSLGEHAQEARETASRIVEFISDQM
jgi:hypothetical protein